MSRPAVSVVMPFAGDGAAAAAAIETLLALDTRPGDELILADNSVLPVGARGDGRGHGGPRDRRAVARVRPQRRRRARAHNDWILFLDADCLAPPRAARRLLRRCPSPTTSARWPARCVAAPGGRHARRALRRRPGVPQPGGAPAPSLPSARRRRRTCSSAARRSSRSAASTRASAPPRTPTSAGASRPRGGGSSCDARRSVEHRYRTHGAGSAPPVARLRRRASVACAPLRGVRARAGRAPGLARAWRRLRRAPPAERPVARRSASCGRRARRAPGARRLLRCSTRCWRPRSWPGLRSPTGRAGPARAHAAQVVLVADRFPARGGSARRVRADARAAPASRPRRVRSRSMPASRASSTVDYREDDGVAARAVALGAPGAPPPAALSRWTACGAGPGEPKLSALAPAVRRLAHERGARVHALGGAGTRATARRIASWPAGRSTRFRASRDAAGPASRPPRLMRVHVVDPSAFTPPYDHALCARAGARRRRRRADHEPLRLRLGRRADGYAVREHFYRHARGAPGGRARSAAKLRRARARHAALPAAGARDADVVHFQWLDVQWLDRHLLPRAAARAHRPRPAAARAAARPGPRPAAPVRRASTRWSSIPSTGARSSSRRSGSSPRKVHVIHHGAFEHLAAPGAAAAARPSWRGSTRRWSCSSACCARTRASTCCSRRGGEGRRRRAVDRRDARGWTSSRCGRALRPGVRFVSRFVSDAELAGVLSPGRRRRAARTRGPSASTSPACWRQRSRSPSRPC